MRRAFLLALACLILCPALVAAQNRSRTISAQQRRGRSGTAAASPSTNDISAGAKSLAEQVKSLGEFLYLFGPISRDIASNQAAAQGSQQGASDLAQRNKAKLQDAFRNYRTRMDELEIMFSSSSDLRRFYPRLVGVAADAAAAEEHVAAERYDQAGRTLLEVLKHLTDVLAEMR